MFNIPNGYLKFLETNTFFFSSTIEGLGRVMVNTKFLHNMEINEPQKFMIFKFEITAMHSRGKIHYLTATHNDILHCVNKSILEIYNNERALIHVLTDYIAMFSLQNYHTYKRLTITVKKFNRYYKHKVFLYNASLQSQLHRNSPISYRQDSLIHMNHHKSGEPTFKNSKAPGIKNRLKNMNSSAQFNESFESSSKYSDSSNRLYNPFYGSLQSRDSKM